MNSQVRDLIEHADPVEILEEIADLQAQLATERWDPIAPTLPVLECLFALRVVARARLGIVTQTDEEALLMGVRRQKVREAQDRLAYITGHPPESGVQWPKGPSDA